MNQQPDASAYRHLFDGDYCEPGVGIAHMAEYEPLLSVLGRGNMVELGPGRGEVMRWAESQGFRASGIDCVSITPGVANADLTNAEQFSAALQPMLPRWVWSFDVLEHIPAEHAGRIISTCHETATNGQFHVIWTCSDVRNVNGVPTELHVNRNGADWWLAMFKKHAPSAFNVIIPSQTDGRFGILSLKEYSPCA